MSGCPGVELRDVGQAPLLSSFDTRLRSGVFSVCPGTVWVMNIAQQLKWIRVSNKDLSKITCPFDWYLTQTRKK